MYIENEAHAYYLVGNGSLNSICTLPLGTGGVFGEGQFFACCVIMMVQIVGRGSGNGFCTSVMGFLAGLTISTRNVTGIRPMITALTNYSPRVLLGTGEAVLGRLC